MPARSLTRLVISTCLSFVALGLIFITSPVRAVRPTAVNTDDLGHLADYDTRAVCDLSLIHI